MIAVAAIGAREGRVVDTVLLDALLILLAFGGPPLAAGLCGGLAPRRGFLVGQALLATACAAIVALAILAAGHPPDRIGLVAPTWMTPVHAVAVVLVVTFGTVPVATAVLARLGGGFGTGFDRLAGVPRPWLVVGIVVGAIVEELLYRAVPVAVFDQAGVPRVLVFVLIVGAFGLALVPLWGWRAALAIAIASLPLSVGYMIHGDLAANILAHAVVDLRGLVYGAGPAAREGRGGIETGRERS